MPIIRVAGATLNQTPLDFRGNQQRILNLLNQARATGVELLCLPELCLTGYGCEDAFFSMHTVRTAAASLKELLPATHGIAVVFGLPHYHAGALYNVAVMAQDGHILGANAKRVLPREGVHYEPRWFRPWPFGKVVETEIAGFKVPLGDLRYRFGDVGVGLEICEEAWDSAPASEPHADAVEIILNPSASHFAIGKAARREHLIANSSRSLHVHYVYSNLVGCEAGRIIYDGGVLIAAAGEIVVRGPRFGFNDGALVSRDVNTDSARIAKLKGHPVKELHNLPVATASSGFAVEVKGRAFKTTSTASATPVAPPVFGLHTQDDFDPFTEFTAAVMLGLFDYLRKSRAQGFVLSLSGGCDSTSCAVLVAHMIAAAVQELGVEQFRRRLGIAESKLPLTQQLLTCVYQATRHSGSVTETAARRVAEALGATYQRVDIDPAVELYTELATAALGRGFSWEHDDITLQNIQARSRAPLIWMIANAKNALLLTTSNRSEGAVGYATMDGDTAGGLAPLAGIDKSFLRRWLSYAETTCPLGLGPLAVLSCVTVQAPTAELRPTVQTDESDLMPYDVLACLERCLVRDFLGPDETLQVLQREFVSLDLAVLSGYQKRFYQLWTQSQWKRERLAPSFYVDDPSVDPRTACRYPILSGERGYVQPSSTACRVNLPLTPSFEG